MSDCVACSSLEKKNWRRQEAGGVCVRGDVLVCLDEQEQHLEGFRTGSKIEKVGAG